MSLFSKITAAGLAAVTAVAFTATTTPADARCGFGCGLGFGIVGGVIAGAAVASAQPRYAPPPGVYYAPGYVYYTGPVEPGCHTYKWVDEWGRKHKDQICH